MATKNKTARKVAKKEMVKADKFFTIAERQFLTEMPSTIRRNIGILMTKASVWALENQLNQKVAPKQMAKILLNNGTLQMVLTDLVKHGLVNGGA